MARLWAVTVGPRVQAWGAAWGRDLDIIHHRQHIHIHLMFCNCPSTVVLGGSSVVPASYPSTVNVAGSSGVVAA